MFVEVKVIRLKLELTRRLKLIIQENPKTMDHKPHELLKAVAFP